MSEETRPVATPRKVGVLGGMGPEATVLLMRRVIELTSARDDADHVPLFVDQNTQAPSRIAALLEGGGDSPEPVLASMARRLVIVGARALAMPCNTAHVFAEAIEAAAPQVPFLNMIELTADRLAARVAPGGRVGMLASPVTQRLRLYDDALAARGLTALWPQDPDAMLDAIRRLKRDGADIDARATLRRAASDLAEADAAALCVACTEFSIAAADLPGGLAQLDALDVLAEAIRDFSLGEPGARS